MEKVLILLAFLFGLSARAQQPFPTAVDDPAWSVLDCIYGTGVWCSTETYHYYDTASLCGHSYSSLLHGGTTMYVRNEGQRTLFRLGTDCSDKEYLMYDYSLAVGDTAYCGLNMMDNADPDTAIFIVDSINTVVFQGVDRRRFSMRFDRCNFGDLPLFSTMDWIEGVGASPHPFFPIACICDFCESGYLLLCVDSAETSIYRGTDWDVCDTTFIITSIPEKEGGGLTLHAYQDQSAKALIVQVERGSSRLLGQDLQFSLIGMDGRNEAHWSASATVNGEWRLPLPSLAGGIYIVHITDGTGMIVSQRILIQ